MPYAQNHTLALIERGRKCENRDLLFSRFTDPSLKDDARRTFLSEAITRKPDRDTLRARCSGYNAFLGAIPDAVSVFARNQARLLFNMSGGVLENAGCSLDRLTGLPRIPGSAVKGIARHAALDALKSALGENPAETLADIALVFGWISADWKSEADFAYACAEHLEVTKDILKRRLRCDRFPDSFSGSVAFFDALPNEPLANDLELDIVTSHHQQYYAGKIDIAFDNEEPIPVVFPAIAPGHIFRFTLAPISTSNVAVHGDLLAKAKTWLLAALTLHGAGAKTAAGYGWFEPVSIAENTAVQNVQPSSDIISAIQNLAPQPLAELVNKFTVSEQYWPKDKDVTFQRSLLEFLAAIQTPTKNQRKALTNLQAKFIPHE